MNILGVQLILLCFAFFMIYVLFLHWKKKEISSFSFSVWIFIWTVFVLIAIFPKTLETLILKQFFVRVMDFGMIVAFIILTYLTFENNVKIKKYEKQTEKLIRILAVNKKQK
ncbi:MAG: DUF2304 domain-containing protein [Candidatus Shapirobacteria bacterium]|nr:DUF2304 domain-containing protein [Candidatus Shapirobacteria bacterium]